VIADSLAGQRVCVTGATGFLGTALVERLLRSVPGCEVVVLVRPGRRRSAVDRVERDVLRNDCFDRLREELGAGFDEMIERRLHVAGADVGVDGLGLDDHGKQLLASCDVVIHSAATVSFDAPLDAAVEVNLLGPSRLAEVIAEVSAGRKGGPPHLIAVSTAYVAGTRRGDAHESLLPDTPYATEVDWRAEVAAAARVRSDLDAESRRPEQLASFTRSARAELGAAGTPLLAERAERRRSDWVKKQLVDAGRARAQGLGWPDAYAYSKALGERALLERRAGLPLTFVRPSIIESALAEPHPGWIRGFRMAEPVIISYGRGLLSQFPGIPEGIIDVIPVDLVAAAIIAIAAHGPDHTGPSVVQVASGGRNPLFYRRLVDLTREWFTEHPLYDSDGQPIMAPDWSFPGRGKVQRQLGRATRALGAAERVLATLPVRGRRADLSARIEERRAEAERALGYVDLYGAYAETEARFRVDRLLALWAALPAEERQRFCFDPAAVEWDHYVQEIHLPSVVAQARVRTTGGRRRGPDRAERSRRAILSPGRHLAAFDLENTLISSNVVESYAWLASRHLPIDERARLTFRILREVPSLLSLDRRDRGDFLRFFYRRYEDAPVEVIGTDAAEMFSDLILAKSFPAALRRVREHRALGHRTLLITGALDFVVEPLRPLFDEVVCARLRQSGGRLSGELVEAPPTGEARALLLADYAASENLRLDESVAYADSTSDLPMLEAVGYPVAVNPEAKLATIARRRGWHVEHWERSPGSPGPLLPMGPLDSGRRWGRQIPPAPVASEGRS
jgi:fatty acyl-CoA reductase